MIILVNMLNDLSQPKLGQVQTWYCYVYFFSKRCPSKAKYILCLVYMTVGLIYKYNPTLYIDIPDSSMTDVTCVESSN